MMEIRIEARPPWVAFASFRPPTRGRWCQLGSFHSWLTRAFVLGLGLNGRGHAARRLLAMRIHAESFDLVTLEFGMFHRGGHADSSACSIDLVGDLPALRWR